MAGIKQPNESHANSRIARWCSMWNQIWKCRTHVDKIDELKLLETHFNQNFCKYAKVLLLDCMYIYGSSNCARVIPSLESMLHAEITVYVHVKLGMPILRLIYAHAEKLKAYKISL